MKINYVIGAFLCVLGCYGCSSPKTEVKSPDGHIKMALTVDDNGKPLYNILVGDSLLIENSTLGFTEKNGIDLGEGFQIKTRLSTVKMKHGRNHGVKIKPIEIIIMRWR